MNNNSAIETVPLADVQNYNDTRHLNINKVGVKGVKHPLRIKDRYGKDQHTVADINMYVFLPHNFKGTHMSRLIDILETNDEALSLSSFQDLLLSMVNRLESQAGTIEMNFPYFIQKSAPVSGLKSLMNYEVTLLGSVSETSSELTIKVVVPVTSLCPCSKEISKYGAHNQRSHIIIAATVAPESEPLFIEDIVEMGEASASSQLYGLLKRPDEKYVTEKAYENPKFVEDIVRDVASLLNDDERIAAYVVEVENFESIHNHSAYALIEQQK